jgi:hypothetical protein
VVSACLAKNPDDRFQTAHDVKLELKWISEKGTQAAAPEVSAKARSQVLPWVIATTAVIVLAAATFLLSRRNNPMVHYRMVSYREGILQAARFSHDGQTTVHSGQWEGEPAQVTTARVGSPESRPLGIPSAILAAVSPSDELVVLEGCEYVFLLDWKSCRQTVHKASSFGFSKPALSWTSLARRFARIRQSYGRSTRHGSSRSVRLSSSVFPVAYESGVCSNDLVLGWVKRFLEVVAEKI